MLRRHLNFHQISHRFTSSFANPSFQDLNGLHIMYWNMIISNPSRFKVEPHSKYWYFCIEHWDLLSLRFLENAVLFHIEWLCRKRAGNVNRSPYCYTAVTHWECPASSEQMFLIPNVLCYSLCKRNCVCAVTKFFTRKKTFSCLLWVTRKRSCNSVGNVQAQLHFCG